MRLFTGIALAPNVIDRLSRTLEEMKSTASVNWTPVENLHITCKFIGEWTEDRLHELKAALGNVSVAGPIPISISGFGFFPNPHHAHSFFAGIQSGPRLAELAAAIDQALLPLGLSPETRNFRPHVTLARVGRRGNIRGLREHIASLTDFDFGSFDADAFHLYLSKPPAHGTTRGSIYTILATYDLMREKNTIS